MTVNLPPRIGERWGTFEARVLLCCRRMWLLLHPLRGECWAQACRCLEQNNFHAKKIPISCGTWCSVATPVLIRTGSVHPVQAALKAGSDPQPRTVAVSVAAQGSVAGLQRRLAAVESIVHRIWMAVWALHQGWQKQKNNFHWMTTEFE